MIVGPSRHPTSASPVADRSRALPGVPRRRFPGRRLRTASGLASLVTLGDLLLDVVVRPAGAPERGTDVPGTVRFRAGGSAGNVARASARLGGRVALVCCVGRDAWGDALVASLRADGVRVHAVRVPGPTGRLMAMLSPGGERSFVTHRGAADGLRAAHLREAWFAGAGALHVPAYSLFSEELVAASARAAALAREAGALISVDLASAGPLRTLGRAAAHEAVRSLRPDLLFANRDEAAALLGGGGAARLPQLLELAPLVVVKEGADGCRVLWRGADPADPAARLDVATTPLVTEDTTGAGDAFAAGVLHGLLLAGGGAARPLSASLLRRAVMSGHRTAADLLRRPRAELVI